MEFQPNIGEEVMVTTTRARILRCVYQGLAFQEDVCVHVYKHTTSDLVLTSEEQLAMPYEEFCSVYN